MELGNPFVGFICVGSFWLRRHRFWSFISCSILLPFVSVCWLPPKVIWLLKSPKRMKDLVSCLVRFSSSILLICSCGGMYTEQVVIVLCNATCVDCLGFWLYGKLALWYVISKKNQCAFIGPMSCIVDVVILFGVFRLLPSFRNVSWRQMVAGFKSDISISSSLKFGLIPQQFYWIILCVLDELVCLMLCYDLCYDFCWWRGFQL